MYKKLLLSAATFTLIACGLTVDLGSTFELKHGGSASLKDTAIKVTFHDINDQRCQIGVGCPDGGHADVTLKVVNDDVMEMVAIVVPGNATAQSVGHAFNYAFEVNDLSPQPNSSGAILPKDYQISLIVTRQQQLTDYYWELESMGFSGTPATSILPDTLYALGFDDDRQVRGRVSCNKMRSDYQSTGQTLIFNNPVYTSDVCEHDNTTVHDEQVAFFQNAINGAISYEISASALTIISSDARELNFKGLRKACSIPGNLPTDDFDSCVSTCVLTVPVSMRCVAPSQVVQECSMHCAIH